MGYSAYNELLIENLDEYRYHHSLCVADEAKRLARKYGADPEKAYLAGLLHDLTKCYSDEEHLKIFDLFDIMLSDIEKESNKLWHAISASVYVQKVLKIEDEDIISAIRYHTTAKDNMSLLQKIIYLADYTSADRNYSDVDVMRSLVDICLDEAMLYALTYTIKELTLLNRSVHPDTINAYNEILLMRTEGK